jgi:DNA-binding response OmpR family regulator
MDQKPIAVLLVEDNPADARLIREVLEEGDAPEFELEHVTRLETALERLDRGGLDVVLLDLGLPDSQGIDTFNQARGHATRVPIVVMTGRRDEQLAAETLLGGGQDFLNKGALDLCALSTTIRHAIKRAQGETALRARQLEHVYSRTELLSALDDEVRPRLVPALAVVSEIKGRAATARDLASRLSAIQKELEQAVSWIDNLLSRAGLSEEPGADDESV